MATTEKPHGNWVIVMLDILILTKRWKCCPKRFITSSVASYLAVYSPRIYLLKYCCFEMRFCATFSETKTLSSCVIRVLLKH